MYENENKGFIFVAGMIVLGIFGAIFGVTMCVFFIRFLSDLWDFTFPVANAVIEQKIN